MHRAHAVASILADAALITASCSSLCACTRSCFDETPKIHRLAATAADNVQDCMGLLMLLLLVL